MTPEQIPGYNRRKVFTAEPLAKAKFLDYLPALEAIEESLFDSLESPFNTNAFNPFGSADDFPDDFPGTFFNLPGKK